VTLAPPSKVAVPVAPLAATYIVAAGFVAKTLTEVAPFIETGPPDEASVMPDAPLRVATPLAIVLAAPEIVLV
jgi:hypothetical protein